MTQLNAFKRLFVTSEASSSGDSKGSLLVELSDCVVELIERLPGVGAGGCRRPGQAWARSVGVRADGAC